eukprot:1185013-Prorocentrum_minimum.AAC.2
MFYRPAGTSRRGRQRGTGGRCASASLGFCLRTSYAPTNARFTYLARQSRQRSKKLRGTNGRRRRRGLSKNIRSRFFSRRIDRWLARLCNSAWKCCEAFGSGRSGGARRTHLRDVAVSFAHRKPIFWMAMTSCGMVTVPTLCSSTLSKVARSSSIFSASPDPSHDLACRGVSPRVRQAE